MSDEEAIRCEQEAVERLNECIRIIAADAPFYWGWGDGEGGFVLKKLRAAIVEQGLPWAGDFAARDADRYRKKKISRTLSKRVMERDAYRCVVCGTHEDLTCDHIVPESKGGPTVFENLQTMCRPCNSSKGARA